MPRSSPRNCCRSAFEQASLLSQAQSSIITCPTGAAPPMAMTGSTFSMDQAPVPGSLGQSGADGDSSLLANAPPVAEVGTLLSPCSDAGLTSSVGAEGPAAAAPSPSAARTDTVTSPASTRVTRQPEVRPVARVFGGPGGRRHLRDVCLQHASPIEHTPYR